MSVAAIGIFPSTATATSSWPGASDTGYQNAPGYPGSLTPFTGTILSNTTYSFMDFPGAYMGPEIINVTFYGCRFASNSVDDANVRVLGDNITFDYSTFEPSADTDGVPPTPHAQGYQYGISQPYNGYGQITVDHSNFWGWANGIEFHNSTQAKPFVVKNSWFHDARDDGNVDHTDAILENYGGPSYMVFDHNTIASVGNTSGLALQNGNHNGYDHVTITNNYFSGFGYTVNIGGGGAENTNVVFTDNTFGTDFEPTFGPLYGWEDEPGTVWRRNKWHVVSGSYYSPGSDDGKYWLPSGSKSNMDYAGGSSGVVIGDIDEDGDVDSVDLNTLKADYGQTVTGGADPAVDLNVDGKINVKDVSILLKNWTGS